MGVEEPLDSDRMFELLAEPRRRFILYQLRQYGRPIDLSRLAEEAAAWEAGDSDAVHTDVQRVRESLYHDHVPELDDAGVVEFDDDERRVSLTAEIRFLDRDDGLDRQDAEQN